MLCIPGACDAQSSSKLQTFAYTVSSIFSLSPINISYELASKQNIASIQFHRIWNDRIPFATIFVHISIAFESSFFFDWWVIFDLAPNHKI